MRGTLALLLLLPAAGCFHADEPPAEAEIALWTIEMSGGETQREFEILESHAYWRVGLTARSQSSVQYLALGPDGTTYESEPSASFPYTHALRVDSPALGKWTLTIRAASIVDGELRILVPG